MKFNITGSNYVLYNGIIFSPWERFHGGLAVKGREIYAVYRGALSSCFDNGDFEKFDCQNN